MLILDREIIIRLKAYTTFKENSNNKKPAKEVKSWIKDVCSKHFVLNLTLYLYLYLYFI